MTLVHRLLFILLLFAGLISAALDGHGCPYGDNCGISSYQQRENSVRPNTIRAAQAAAAASTPIDPRKYVHCCGVAVTVQCQDACRSTLRNSTSESDLIDALVSGGCGTPALHEPLWQCLLAATDTTASSEPLPGRVPAPSSHSSPGASRRSESRIDRVGLDAAKLHCCTLAVSAPCRRLCQRAFSNDLEHAWAQLDRHCLTAPSEQRLALCLDDVEEPCELGCDGLSFCTAFNARPDELFRSCTPDADLAARWDAAAWVQRGTLRLPPAPSLTPPPPPPPLPLPVVLPSAEDTTSTTTPSPSTNQVDLLPLPIRSSSPRCSPDTWRAVACLMHTRPCHRQTHVSMICRDDCLEVLSECLDWSRVPPGITAASLCSRLSPQDVDGACVPLKPYLQPAEDSEPSGGMSLYFRVTTPCRGHPCEKSEVCQPNRHCVPGTHCVPYKCVPGCQLGEVSRVAVPVGSLVRIPLNLPQRSCYKVCQCGENGVVDGCHSLPCYHLDSCLVAPGKRIEHGSVFHLDCSTGICTCYAGELLCSRRACITPGKTSIRAISGLPCNCRPHYVPVCGRNGRTYPSACLAKCAELTDADYDFGSCMTTDPCAREPCGPTETCVQDRKVCLSLLQKPCHQYTCVNITGPCSRLPERIVCDTMGQEHANLCFMLHAGRHLAYYGHCRTQCSRTGTVCGIDGNTYMSECAAHASMVSVDYPGPCVAVGGPNTPVCGEIEPHCPPLDEEGCLGIIPPGACCPICAGAMRVLFSQKQVDRVVFALRETALLKQVDKALTLGQILRDLHGQVQVPECELRGYISLEQDIVVLLVPRFGGRLQREVCVAEAEKLASLVKHGSGRLQAQLSLSVLAGATVAHKPVGKSGAKLTVTHNVEILSAAIFLTFFVNRVTWMHDR